MPQTHTPRILAPCTRINRTELNFLSQYTSMSMDNDGHTPPHRHYKFYNDKFFFSLWNYMFYKFESITAFSSLTLSFIHLKI